MKPPTVRQEKIAAVFASEIWPLLHARSAELLMRSLPAKPAARAFEVGCADGRLSLEVAARLARGGHLTAIDASAGLIALAEAEKARRGGKASVSFQVGELAPPFPVAESECDLVFSNLALSDVPDPASTLRALATSLGHGGTLLATMPVRGCWAEFLDLYRDVLAARHRSDALAALRAYESTLPTPTEAEGWLQSAGLTDRSVETMRWELLFKSAREFFFSPVVELGPLALWQQIAGGRGDAMQEVFFHVKEAIDAYFSGRPFPVTLVAACLRGGKP